MVLPYDSLRHLSDALVNSGYDHVFAPKELTYPLLCPFISETVKIRHFCYSQSRNNNLKIPLCGLPKNSCHGLHVFVTSAKVIEDYVGIPEASWGWHL